MYRLTKSLAGLEQQVHQSLGEVSSELARTGPGCWRFELSNGCVFPATAALDGHLLTLDAELGGEILETKQLWSLLEANAGLAGLAKLTLAADRRTPALRAEVELEASLDGAQNIVHRCCESLHLAHARWSGEEASTAGSREQAVPDELPRQLEELGWQAHTREGGSLVVDLDVRRDYYQAALRTIAGTWLLITAPLARFDALDAESHEALARLLLEAGSAVRFVRPAIDGTADPLSPRFEVCVPQDAAPAAMGRALSALSVACSSFGPEARLLADRRAARTYLKVRGPVPAPSSMSSSPRLAREGGAAQEGGSAWD